jgi:hypothetical protein
MNMLKMERAFDYCGRRMLRAQTERAMRLWTDRRNVYAWLLVKEMQAAYATQHRENV